MTISDNKKIELSKEKIDFHLKRTRYLFNEFYITSKKYKTISYLRRNAAGWLIMNIMMEYYFENKELRVEKLASKISSKVCSRATLMSMLKSAEIRKVIKKKMEICLKILIIHLMIHQIKKILLCLMIKVIMVLI